MSDRSPVPDSPDALLSRQRAAKLEQARALIGDLDLHAWESQQLALTLVHHLEKFHDAVVAELEGDAQAPHTHISRWAIDADRLSRCRLLLESVDLE